jgi:hypothetical protein
MVSFSIITFEHRLLLIDTIVQKLNQLRERMKKAWKEDDLFENHFRDWISKLEKLKEFKTDTLSNNI